MYQIYDNFNRIGILKNWLYFEWVRRYNEHSAVNIKLKCTDTLYRLLTIGRYIIRTDVNESAVIVNRWVSRDENGGMTLNIYALSPSFILTQRVVTFNARQMTLNGVINELVTQNVSGSGIGDRRIANFRILPNGIPDIGIEDIQFENIPLYDAVKSLCQDSGIGFKVIYNRVDRTFDLLLYKGKKSSAVFASDYKNIITQDFYEYGADYKNVVLVGRTFVGNASGINRYEAYLTPNSEDGSIIQQGNLFLQDYRRRTAFNTTINARSKQFPYLEYWDLGDMVTLRDKILGERQEQVVSEVTECSDANGFHLSATFGDAALTLNEKMARG